MKTLTYKSTRPYDFKLPERHIDFDTLVDNAMKVLNEHHDRYFVDGVIGCTLDLVYPVLELVDSTKSGWTARVERLTEKVHKRFSVVDWEITRLKGNLFGTLDLLNDFLPHKVTTAVRKNKYQLERSIEVGVPCKVGFFNSVFVLDMLLKMIIPDWFQYASSAKLTTWVTRSERPTLTPWRKDN